MKGLVCWLALCLSLFLVTTTETLANDTIRIEHYSVHHGLSQNSVTGVLLDHDGFLWVATENGLNRFDGYRFQSVNGPDNLFQTNYISMIAQTEDNTIWVAIPTQGVFSLSPGDREFKKRMDAEVSDDWWFAEVTDIFIHRDRYYLVTETSLRQLHTDEMDSSLLFEVAQNSEDYYDLLRHALAIDEFVFLATSSGLQVYHTETGQHQAVNHLPEMQDAHADELNTKFLYQFDDELYVATVQGLYSLDLTQVLSALRTNSPMPTATVRDPVQNVWQIIDHDGQLLLATQNGLYTYTTDDPQASLLLRFEDTERAIFDNSIHHLTLDGQGNLWLGTAFNGLFHWRPSTRQFHIIAQGMGPYPDLSSNQVWTLAQDLEQRLWVGTQNGLNQLNPDGSHEVHFHTQHDSAYIHEGTVYDIFPDPHNANHIWLYHAEYMYLFNTEEDSLTPLQELVDNPADATLLEDYFWGYNLIGDRLWFANAEGLYVFDTQEYRLQRYTDFDHLQFDLMNVHTILGSPRDNPDALFLGLASELWLFNMQDNSLRRLYRHEPYQLYSLIYPESFVYDDQGRIWFTMLRHGLLALDAETLKPEVNLGINEGLPASSLYQGHLDQYGYLWFSSMQGIIRFHPQTLHHERFSYMDGASSNEFNANASVRLDDGRIAYGSMRGLTLFNPSDLKPGQRTLNTRISGVNFITSGERLNSPLADLNGSHIDLNYNTPGIRIDVSTNSFERPHMVFYSYRLEGPEPVYIARTQEASISFPRLPPGHHTLTVRAIDPRNGNYAKTATLTIQVAYHPLLSPTAWVSYILIVSLALASFLKYRYQQHQRIIESKARAERSEERLQLAIGATNSGIWDWHYEGDRLFETRMQLELGYSDDEPDMTMAIHQNRIHRRDLDDYLQSWQQLQRGQRNDFSCTYRLRHADGRWLWYRDVGQVTRRNRDGTVERVTGAFQNITHERSNEEKALLFGKAIEQTKDWVLLLDGDQMPLTANRAFCDALGIENDKIDDFNFMNLSAERLHYYREIIKQLRPGQQWRNEDVIRLADNDEVPVIINISAVADDSIGSRAYVIVFTDIRAQKEAEHQLRRLANYDALTGLPNRALLNQRIDETLALDEKKQVALMFMDLDRFKQINDSLGHSIGDKLLCVIAERVQHCLRSVDTVARLGGDEFIILLHANSLRAVEETAQRVLHTVNEPLVIDKHHIRVSPSIGVALHPQHGQTREELLKHADVAMYHAKDAGRNCYRLFKDEMDTRVRAQLNLEVELKHAISQQLLTNSYQPIVNAARNQCVGVELLMRWQHENTNISPDVFIPVAEELGVIVTMTNVALRQACLDLKELRALQPDLYLSVNLSVRHLEQDDLIEQLQNLLQDFDLPPSALRLELTEGVLIEETLRASQIMNRLRDLGIQLMLDDFGTGYSSLRYLKEFPLNVIKIDRTFTTDIGCDRSDEAIIESILAMASNLDKICIAEGVESEAQRSWLLARGCYLMQGYLFGGPMPIQRALKWFSEPSR
ncbi:EAL domain-containing protein [Aliidiomarina soli]|uniref:Diguanylate cyclase n=1 Tax=Aliidiomarina soli TaxID=1928574 RepID=A0A432WC93_9GAMM|nr:EAL domain-containing protein [Aliidiomarina soli]RUO29625.1 hypothetical protein CWE14_14305 [Aliidiomarina soli]